MGAYNIVNPASMVAGQNEDISVVLANFQAIQAVLSSLDNSNIAVAAAIARSKLDFGAGLVNADISAAAAIAKSKLAALGIVDADVAAGAAIAVAKLAAGVNGQVLTTVAGAPAWAAASGGVTVSRMGATQSQVNPTADTAVWTQVIGAGAIGVAGLMHVTVIGDAVAGVASAFTLRVKFGGVTFDTFPSNGNLAPGSNPFVLQFFLQNKNVANSNVGRSVLDGYAVAGATHTAAAQSVDTSIAQNLVISANYGTGNAGHTITLHQGTAVIF